MIPGDTLLQATHKAVDEAVLVAPFVKEEPLNTVLQGLSTGVRVCLFTRWRPEEVASGISDTGVLRRVRDEFGGRVYLVHHLHAKYYRFDDITLVGSANLTGRGLGWSDASNLELLLEVEARPEFEKHLFDVACEATDRLAALVNEAAKDYENLRIPDWLSSTSQKSDYSAFTNEWLPATRYPENLLMVCQKRDDLVTQAAYDDAVSDLDYLRLPSGLSEEDFFRICRAVLSGLPVIVETHRRIDRERRFGEMRSWVKHRYKVDDNTASRVWQTLFRWLLFFFGDRFGYKRPRHSEIIFPK